jgi:hypothetical protein
VRGKHRDTLEAIFEKPRRANIPWRDILGLLDALGAEISEGKGSRVRVVLGERKAVFHRPHPEKEASKGLVGSVRRLLEEEGIGP